MSTLAAGLRVGVHVGNGTAKQAACLAPQHSRDKWLGQSPGSLEAMAMNDKKDPDHTARLGLEALGERADVVFWARGCDTAPMDMASRSMWGGLEAQGRVTA